MNITEHLVAGSDNTITLTLTEASSPISLVWTQLDVVFGGVTITRTANGDGITFSGGVLNLIPGSLTTAEKAVITALPKPKLFRTYITVTAASEPSGVVFGASDSENKLYLYVTSPT